MRLSGHVGFRVTVRPIRASSIPRPVVLPQLTNPFARGKRIGDGLVYEISAESIEAFWSPLLRLPSVAIELPCESRRESSSRGGLGGNRYHSAAGNRPGRTGRPGNRAQLVRPPRTKEQVQRLQLGSKG